MSRPRVYWRVGRSLDIVGRLGYIGASIAIFWAPFGTAINYLVGLLPLAVFLAIVIGGPLGAAFRIHREQEKEIADLRIRLSKKQSEEEIHQKQRQKFQKQIDGLRPEEKESLRQLHVKGRMQPQDFQQCSIEKNLPHVDTNRMKVIVSFLQHDKATGFWTIEPSVRDLIAELLLDH